MNTVNPKLVEHVRNNLEQVCELLRSMRGMADSSIGLGSLEALANSNAAVIGLSERCHLILDDCIVAMGGDEIGNFKWDYESAAASEGGAA